jgi:hypothetical protein
MNLSKRPLDWILLALALATFIAALISFADFSGNSAPQWRRIALFSGLALSLLANGFSVLSGRHK